MEQAWPLTRMEQAVLLLRLAQVERAVRPKATNYRALGLRHSVSSPALAEYFWPLPALDWRWAAAAERRRLRYHLSEHPSCRASAQHPQPENRSSRAGHQETSSLLVYPESPLDQAWSRRHSSAPCRAEIHSRLRPGQCQMCHRPSNRRLSNSPPCRLRWRKPPRGVLRFLSCSRSSASSKCLAHGIQVRPTRSKQKSLPEQRNLVAARPYAVVHNACGTMPAHDNCSTQRAGDDHAEEARRFGKKRQHPRHGKRRPQSESLRAWRRGRICAKHGSGRSAVAAPPVRLFQTSIFGRQGAARSPQPCRTLLRPRKGNGCESGFDHRRAVSALARFYVPVGSHRSKNARQSGRSGHFAKTWR